MAQSRGRIERKSGDFLGLILMKVKVKVEVLYWPDSDGGESESWDFIGQILVPQMQIDRTITIKISDSGSMPLPAANT